MMAFTPAKLNSFLFFKLPSAYWSGVRVSVISSNECQVRVRHKWFNQNPFKSMYFAVQAMAAELATGALVMSKIQESGEKISMLVAQNNATFTKKATGVLTFTCSDVAVIEHAITATLATGEGQTFWMRSVGVDQSGAVVSEFHFEWTVRLKPKQ